MLAAAQMCERDAMSEAAVRLYMRASAPASALAIINNKLGSDIFDGRPAPGPAPVKQSGVPPTAAP